MWILLFDATRRDGPTHIYLSEAQARHDYDVTKVLHPDAALLRVEHVLGTKPQIYALNLPYRQAPE